MWLKEIQEKFLPLIPNEEKNHAEYLISILKSIDQKLRDNHCSGLTFFHSVTLYKHLANLCTRGVVNELPEDVFGDISNDYPVAFKIASDILLEIENSFPGVNQKGEKQHLTIIISDLT